jgi:hypothetical protein
VSVFKRVLKSSATIATAAFATLGLVTFGTVTAILVTGLLEGMSAVPDAVSSGAGIIAFVAALALAGRVCALLAPAHAVVAALASGAVVALVGWWSVAATEAHGEGVEPVAVLVVALGLGLLLAVSAYLSRAPRRHRVTSSP